MCQDLLVDRYCCSSSRTVSIRWGLARKEHLRCLFVTTIFIVWGHLLVTFHIFVLGIEVLLYLSLPILKEFVLLH